MEKQLSVSPSNSELCASFRSSRKNVNHSGVNLFFQSLLVNQRDIEIPKTLMQSKEVLAKVGKNKSIGKQGTWLIRQQNWGK
jgi:hypothetical protein